MCRYNRETKETHKCHGMLYTCPNEGIKRYVVAPVCLAGFVMKLRRLPNLGL